MSASPSPGDVISHYRILERVGAGGMGEVFRAVDERLDRTVALKLLRAEGSADPATRARFEGEARAASALDHRNVATVYDVGEAPDGRLFIAMAFYEGETLSDRLARGGISPEETRDIGRQIAAGLERAHANGIVHRDIKPSNLMITADGEVKILDFGIAKLADRPGLTGTGVFVGTSGYMAPEQIEAGEIDGRTDVWGLGVVLYQMLTGRPPFGGATAREQLAAVLATDPTPPAVSNPAVPPDLSDLVLEMLARDPSGRPASATEVARRLARPFSGPAPPPRRTRALAGGVVAAAALVAVWFLAPGIAADPIDSIAVLPFDNASPNAEGAYLSAGLANSLVDRLSQIAGLRVVPRALAARYPTGQTDLRQAAAALDVTAIVTGEVSELGDRLIVRADLIDVRTLDNLWSGQFDEPMTDILEVHDSLVGEIVGHLRVELDPDEEEELLERATADPEAFRLVLLSRFHNLSVTEEGVALGRRYALQAIALDSTYARAWAALSDTYLTHVFMGLEAPSEAYPRAIEAAERATRLDPGLAIAYAVLGFARHHGEWDWTGAMEAWERSVELDSTLADGWQGISQGHATAGRTGRAVAAAIRALAADPITPVVSAWLGTAYYFDRQYDAALAAFEHASELEPGNEIVLFGVPTALSGAGRQTDAIVAMRRALATTGGDPQTSPGLASLLAAAGHDDSARAIMARLTPSSGSQSGRAVAWGALGELDLAFEALDRAIERREGGLWFIKSAPAFDPLRDDPRFEDALIRMGLPVGVDLVVPGIGP